MTITLNQNEIEEILAKHFANVIKNPKFEFTVYDDSGSYNRVENPEIKLEISEKSSYD